MKDGSDAVAGWPVPNALINMAHGGECICYSIHAVMVIVSDGTRDAERRNKRVLKMILPWELSGMQMQVMTS